MGPWTETGSNLPVALVPEVFLALPHNGTYSGDFDSIIAHRRRLTGQAGEIEAKCAQ